MTMVRMPMLLSIIDWIENQRWRVAVARGVELMVDDRSPWHSLQAPFPVVSHAG
jgi:hypothetical protein